MVRGRPMSDHRPPAFLMGQTATSGGLQVGIERDGRDAMGRVVYASGDADTS